MSAPPPQKLLRRAYEHNPTAVRRWLEEEYPAIREQARREKAQIHWCDEMGLRSSGFTGQHQRWRRRPFRG